MTKIVKYFLIGLIRAYQVIISPLIPPACRFTPTCSEYAKDAVTKHGPIKGSGLALKRLLKCHPFGSSGFDPVPEKKDKENK